MRFSPGQFFRGSRRGNSLEFRALRSAAFRLAGWQIAITVVVAAVAGMLGGEAAVRSALMGGGIGVVAGLYQALRMFRFSAAIDPARFYRGVWVSEAVKILLTVALFIFAIRVLRPVFAPMIVAYAATFLAYWAALGTGYPWITPRATTTKGADNPTGNGQDGR
ncbi:MAG: ATP synthase subunit I [Gammaproteobacteria bacterium]|nr:ATP synthase subunit I [Gammaproteobacteria bacterium]MDH5275629.1 ATP synthase subunit I [Gammaproteobacteria bacterium]